MAWLSAFALGAALLGDLTYSHDVKPVLDDHCIECHHPGGRDPDLTVFPFQSKGGADESQVVAKLLEMVQPAADGTDAKMPPGSRPKLDDTAIQILKQWRDQGLKP